MPDGLSPSGNVAPSSVSAVDVLSSALSGDRVMEADDTIERLVRTPLAAFADPRPGIMRQLIDPAVTPDRTRLRRLDQLPEAGDELVSMGDIFVTKHGGSIRTFTGNLAHENGWWPSFKRRRLQYWEGMTQRAYLLRCEVDPDVDWAQSEARRFEFPLGGRRHRYTCDVEVRKTDGSTEIVELKRDERDLDDEDYRLTLAGVAEICRRCGWTFKIVLAGEIFGGRHHRENVELFQSRRFARVGPEHLRRLEDFAFRQGQESTYGELAEALEPDFAPAGKAVLQALLVRRRVNIDLTQLLYDETPVQII